MFQAWLISRERRGHGSRTKSIIYVFKQSKSQVEPLSILKGRLQKMKWISTLQTSRLASPAAFLLHSLRGWRLLWTVARHLATEQLSSHLPWPQPQSLVWHRVIKMNMPSCSSNRNLPRKMKLENTDPDGYCLAWEPAQLEHLPTKPYQASAKGFSRLSWSCNKAFTLAACVSAWGASSCPLSKGPRPDLSEILKMFH